MRRITFAAAALALAWAPARLAAGDEAKPMAPSESGVVDWAPSLAKAFEAGKKDGKPIFIAVNSERVDGGKLEPAGKMLREEVYLDPAVVAKSRAFACALLKSDGNSADFGEIRGRFGIDGLVVSPQHMFAYADGTLIERHEYWPTRGTGPSVIALVEMMDVALKKAQMRLGTSVPSAPQAGPPSDAGMATEPSAPEAGAPPAVPSADDARTAWITRLVDTVRKGGTDAAARDVAIGELVKGDKKGDCLEPLCHLLLELKKDEATQVAILKVLGKPNLLVAVPTVIELLGARDADVRGNAAVTLEYIGDARAAEPLRKRAAMEQDENVKCNLCRALGRCGAKQAPYRKFLQHEVDAAKVDKDAVGPLIGLAYFEKDADAARGVEKMLAKVPLGARRSVGLWVLTEIGDPKSAAFVEKEILPNSAKQAGPWGNRIYEFVMNVVTALKVPSDDEAKGAVFGGVGFSLDWAGWSADAARKGRDMSSFRPKGEFGNSGKRPNFGDMGGMGG